MSATALPWISKMVKISQKFLKSFLSFVMFIIFPALITPASIYDTEEQFRKFQLFLPLSTVIKRWGRGFPPATMNVVPGYFHRKIEEK